MSNAIKDFDPIDFLKSGLIGAIGQKPDFQITLYAMEWYKDGFLETDDLAEIQTAIKNQYIVEETESETLEETETEIDE